MRPECHLNRETDEKLKDKAYHRQITTEMVLQGAMQGYVVALTKLYERGYLI